MAYHFVIKYLHCLCLYYRNCPPPGQFYVFPSLRQNLGGCKFEEEREAGTVVAKLQKAANKLISKSNTKACPTYRKCLYSGADYV
jgi:hypothetical protein